jgi:uncharacterized protein YjbI with pentapeptide repeats
MNINSKATGEVLYTIDSETLVGADLSKANLTGAELSGANLDNVKVNKYTRISSSAKLSPEQLIFTFIGRQIFLKL